MLLLIDLSALFWANWHATADRELSAAYELTIDKVRRIAERYEHVAVAIDCPPYKRKEIYQEYKAQRDTPAENAVEQFRRVKDRLTADGYLMWGVTGYEADDIIATAVNVAVERQISVDIYSGDKDLLQLVSDEASVRCISPRTGDTFCDQDVLAKFGAPPSKMRDLLALMGDKSDNIPGVPGVGPKTAAKLLAEYGHLSGVMSAVSSGAIDGKLKESLMANMAQLDLSRKLVTLIDNAPIDFEQLFAERKQESIAEPAPEIPDAEFEEETQPAASLPEPEEPRSEKRPVESAAPRETEIASPGAIVRVNPMDVSLEPASMKQADWLARQLCDARSFGVPNPGTALAIIMKGRALGIDAVTSLTNFHMVEGKPTMSAQLIIGLVKSSPLCELFQLIDSSRERCVWRTKRVRESPVEMEWTLQDAKEAGLYGRPTKSGKPSNWDKMPRTMLRWRCGVELARAVYPDIVAGVYDPDEIRDMREAG